MFQASAASLAVDLFALLDSETNGGPEKERQNFLSVLKAAEKFLPTTTLKERLEVDTLGEVGVLKNPKKFFNSVIKQKTRLFYKQQKFNLFREESEGYAKLVTELNAIDSDTPEKVIGVVRAIVGYFYLDPNRVLDVILEAFESQLEQRDFFVQLLRLFTPDVETLNELLAFKIQFYAKDAGGIIPESVFRLVAVLIQCEILDLESVYETLTPEDDVIRESAEKELQDAKTFLRKSLVVSTNKSDNDAEKEAEDETSRKAAVDRDAAKNQKFGLIKALLDMGAWNEAESVLARLPPYSAVSVPFIAKSLQTLIKESIEPLYCKCRKASTDPPRKTKSNSAFGVDTFEEFQRVVVPMLLTLGPHGHDDGILLYSVIRIIKTSLGLPLRGDSSSPSNAELTASPLYYDALTLMDEVFLPSLSLTDGNCGLAEEIWSVLRVYPYHCRYRLYGQWKSDAFANHPRLLRKKSSLQKNIKRIMQRISKENVKPTSRHLGKLTHGAPGLLFDYVLSQIQLYDNLIGPVVDSFKYITSLSLDVLAYSVIEALNNPEKDRTKHDSTSISLWLQSLSNFCGAVFKKYSIELTGLLQYVINQLKSKKSLDLLILKEVVLKMGGIEAAEEMTPEQIEAMSGGELLRQEAGSFAQIKNTRKSSQRLKDALIDNNLAVPLCILMAQQRNCVIFEEEETSHLKLVGKLFDQCQDTLVQFGTFLASNLSVDDYTRRLPAMTDLLSCYHVNLDLAFFLARPMFNHMISLKYDDVLRQHDKNEKNRLKLYTEATTEVMRPVIEAVRPLHPAKIWDDISPQFVTTFWSLTMYDLLTPDSLYEKEIAKLKAAPAKVDENRDMPPSRKKREKDRLLGLMEKLIDEQRRQKDHVAKVRARLEDEKDSWFFSRSARLAKNEAITSFLQLCLFPRCVFTASDAIYCAKFVYIVHMLKAPNFSTLICLDRILCDITYTVTSCTENEAHRYGRFLAAILEMVKKWHASKDVFEKECHGSPGFVTKFKAKQNITGAGTADSVDYENYRHVCHKWHYKLTKALVVCLESKDYVQIRNAITILIKILPSFPEMLNLSNLIEKRIDKVCAEEKEQRPDLYVMATSYMGQLKARKATMLKEADFHISKRSELKTTNTESSPSTKKSTSKEREMTSSSSTDQRHRSQSREKSVSSDRRSRRERESQSREKSVPKSSSSLASAREKMGPPSKTSSSSTRRSADPTTATEDRELKRRKLEEEAKDSQQQRRRGKDVSHSSRERSAEENKEKKSDRKRVS